MTACHIVSLQASGRAHHAPPGSGARGHWQTERGSSALEDALHAWVYNVSGRVRASNQIRKPELLSCIPG